MCGHLPVARRVEAIEKTSEVSDLRHKLQSVFILEGPRLTLLLAHVVEYGARLSQQCRE
jgi:hypothetical protein